MRLIHRADTQWYSIGPPRGRRGQTSTLLAICIVAAAVLLLLGWLVLGWSRWRDFLSSAFVTVAALLLTISFVESALEYLRHRRLRPLRDELLRSLLNLTVTALGNVSLVTGQPSFLTDRPSEELTNVAHSLLNKIQTLQLTRFPRSAVQMPQEEESRYEKWGEDAAGLMHKINPWISSQIVPLLATIDEDAELLRRSFRLITAIQQPKPWDEPSASRALSYISSLVLSASSMVDHLQANYEQDPAWNTVLEEAERPFIW